MKLSRFVGPNTREVLRMVRDALGEDALIVSNRRVDGGIEIIATVESDVEDAVHDASTGTPGSARPSPAPAAAQPAAAPAAPAQPAVPAYRDTAPAQPAMPAYRDTAPAQPAVPAYRDTAPTPQPAPARPAVPAYGHAAAYAAASPMPVPAPTPSARFGAGPAAAHLPMSARTSVSAMAATYGATFEATSARAAEVDAPDEALADVAPAAPSPEPVPAPRNDTPRAVTPEVEDIEDLGAVDAPLPVAPAASMARRPDTPMPGTAGLPGLPMHSALGAEPSVQAAIDALRGALESRMDGMLWGNRAQTREPVNAGLFRTLLEAGFSMPLVRALLERLPEHLDARQAMAWARNELVTHLPVLRAEEDFFSGGGVYALVGPTGVGKTTTLAKLAARCVAREGRDQVAMLTTDNFRIGALEQLQIYGRLMGVPADSVRDAAELRSTLARLGNRKIILIDTTGISQRDRNVAEQAALLTNAGQPVRRLLVLNAASQGDTLDEVAHAYRNGVGEDVVGCIITKLDEASRLAPALDTAIRHRLPIHYVSQGQRVPEHLDLADRSTLVDAALATLNKTRALYAPSEADLAALWNTSSTQSERDPLARRRLLAAAMHRPVSAGEADGELEQALGWLAADPACAHARAAWRVRSGAAGDDAATSDDADAKQRALSEAMLAMVRREFPAACQRYVLALHGKATLKGNGLPGGVAHATFLMSDRGAALAAPVQQLMLPHGALATHVPGSAVGPVNAADALLSRAEYLAQALGNLPHVHLFDMGTTALSLALSAEGHLWLARSPGALRILHEDCPTTLHAISRQLGYLPAGPVPGQPENALWACGTEIGLSQRGKEGGRLRMICARIVDMRSGKVIAQYYGLTNLSTGQADAATIARWLVQQEQAKAAFRYLPHAWSALPAVHTADGLAAQALLAGQVAAACWQLAHTESAQMVRGPLAGLVSPDERKLPGKLLPVALLKMFAMLEMVD
ncbi:flagellar biosynthesis protein FlhF [Bordetella genomosp. 5]|uniref:flagellar biosynthesis protein FlhF n=1 Tax=Bordetella genomosp. 5 TaxID=1395608 RepID=UPI000B9E467E|nr:flagellar biosynthesis protein FlhF [Bordetella genomosp. 5]OZI44993.1 flagellar biosynthesis protein FlhF [Bordetella genomosp. 5]